MDIISFSDGKVVKSSMKEYIKMFMQYYNLEINKKFEMSLKDSIKTKDICYIDIAGNIFVNDTLTTEDSLSYKVILSEIKRDNVCVREL